ncbi:YsnF/AvaK domain-containing protein [Rhizobium sp. CG5]|uniref:YsnF/AvaK domain-containing protein n=1 Tax=Rhizobium sp. CG5 TaxID=2726076 RepID=UPI0020333AC3|nr:YsnF/AvaK domain-containing protein [Rhizobium sp. CG5]MCM2476439.1 YsnF/AvaK domain-containing protein [Rhizobium sp. CG5]
MTYTDQTATTTNSNTITAFFDSRADADSAVERLVEAGISRSSVSVIEGGSAPTASSSTSESTGFWASLENFFFPDEDRHTYAEGLRRGGYLVTVSGYAFDMHDIALDILDDEGSIDLDERAQAWESEGWSRTGNIETPAATRLDSAQTAAAQPSRLGADGEEVIPVVQEELRVGKRDVNNGRVRVRSYVTETPVSENLSLRDESVEVTRRTVDRPLTGTENAFVDRTIEAEEHHEEAVVSKEARVVEEISLRKTSEQRDETVSDTVRKTDVEIEDERGEGTARKDGTLGIRRD